MQDSALRVQTVLRLCLRAFEFGAHQKEEQHAPGSPQPLELLRLLAVRRFSTAPRSVRRFAVREPSTAQRIVYDDCAKIDQGRRQRGTNCTEKYKETARDVQIVLTRRPPAGDLVRNQ
eukprot:354540-Rhodomonas_salina.1